MLLVVLSYNGTTKLGKTASLQITDVAHLWGMEGHRQSLQFLPITGVLLEL